MAAGGEVELEVKLPYPIFAFILLDTSGSVFHHFEPAARALAALARQMEWPATLAFYSNEGKTAAKRGMRGLGLNVGEEDFERELGRVKAWCGGESLMDLCESAKSSGLFNERQSLVVVGDFMEVRANDKRLWAELAPSPPKFSASGLIFDGTAREAAEGWLAAIGEGMPGTSIGAMDFELYLQVAMEALALRKEIAQAKAPSIGAALRI